MLLIEQLSKTTLILFNLAAAFPKISLERLKLTPSSHHPQSRTLLKFTRAMLDTSFNIHRGLLTGKTFCSSVVLRRQRPGGCDACRHIPLVVTRISWSAVSTPKHMLSGRDNWNEWFNAYKSTATEYQCWDYCDPEAPEPTSAGTHPPLPTMESAKEILIWRAQKEHEKALASYNADPAPTKGPAPELSHPSEIDIRSTHATMRADYIAFNDIWEKVLARRAKMNTWIEDHVEADRLAFVRQKALVHGWTGARGLAKVLKEQFAPEESHALTAAAEQYNELLALTRVARETCAPEIVQRSRVRNRAAVDYPLR
jgi:hypothetical protein